jgi:hypothetical protein
MDYIVEAETYMNFKKRRVYSVKLAKSENISKTVCSHIYINVTHIGAAFCILLLGMHWQLCTWLRKSRGTTWCAKVEFNQMHTFFYSFTNINTQG